ncbi:MAG: tetratricopeptide repeat protein [Chloroflexota bacterium]
MLRTTVHQSPAETGGGGRGRALSWPRTAVLLLLLLLPFVVGPPANLALATARALAGEGQYGRALLAYDGALAAEPRRLAVFLEAGDLAFATGDYPRATTVYTRACALEPTNAAAWLGLGRTRAATGDLPGAADAFLRAAEAGRDPALAYAAGDALLARADPGAGAALRRATALAAESGGAAVTKAHLRLALLAADARPEEAEEHLARARSVALAEVDAEVGTVEVALAEAKAASGEAHRLAGLGRAALSIAEPALAVDLLRRSLALAPDYADANAYLALALLAGGQPVEAQASAERALVLVPGNQGARYAKAASLRAQGDARGALAELKSLGAEAPEETAFQLEMAHAYADLGDYPTAGDVVARLAEARSGEVAALLGAAHFHLDRAYQVERAVGLAERAVVVAPTDPAAWDAFGWALHLGGREGEAVVALTRAAALDPLAPTVRYHLGVVYERQGALSQARAAYLRALDLAPFVPQAPRVRQALAGTYP